MPRVRLDGHQHRDPVSDVLRLFFGLPVLSRGQDCLQANDAGPELISCLRPAGNGQVMISTTLEGDRRALADDLRMSVVVPENKARREIKRQLYELLSSWSGLEFPWGSLTGIRPTLVAQECLDRGISPDAARRELTGFWHVSPDKADLALETASAERSLIQRIPRESAMVYLGVPFCPSRCSYCSFITQDAGRQAHRLASYVEAVLSEANGFFARWIRPMPISAVYVGGGTPTSLPDNLFERLLKGVLAILPLLPDAELTVEAGRPDTVTPAKLAIIRDCGATRLCINPQTFHDDTLVRIGRGHTAAQTLSAFQLAPSMGFGRINMDLIAGLPGETPADFADSLRQALALMPESITVHSLAIKRSSRLRQQELPRESHRIENQKKDRSASRLPALAPSLPDPDLEAMLEQAGRDLRAAGLFPYYLYRQKDAAGGLENTGFAAPGAGCHYNVGMMGDACPIIGLGSGSMSKRVAGRRVERQPNPRDIGAYIIRVDEMVRKKADLFNGDAG